MRLVYILFSLFIILNFSGCASKKLEEPNIKQNIETTEKDQDEDFLDEFNDELEIEEIYDPFSKYNTIMTNFNDNLYIYFLEPIAKGYKYTLNKKIRKSVKNFFHNILFPVRFVNNILQFKFSNATTETKRFILNSTVGFLGLFDTAKSEFKLQVHDEDFGQTLGYWGIGSGPHIVLPFFGPSNFRDALSISIDSYFNPIIYNEETGYNITHNTKETLGIILYKTVNNTSLELEKYGEIKKDAVELYPYLRDIYEQYRDKQIKE